MKYKHLGPWALLAALLLAAVPALAHQSIASAYDFSKPLVLKGTVKDVEFINPHSMLRIDDMDPKREGELSTPAYPLSTRDQSRWANSA
jgi:hypothetical protein